MSISLIFHPDFIIYSYYFHTFLFSKKMPIHKYKKQIKYKNKNHYYTKKLGNIYIIHKLQNYTKQKGTFILSIIYLIPAEKVFKSLHSPSPLKRLRNAFSKTQVHLNSNALAFSSKRKRVFYKALWGFPPNTSVFSPEISLFTQIFPYLIT